MIFLKDIKKYDDSTFRQRFRLFKKVLKKCLKDPFFDTDFFMGSRGATKIKHLVTMQEFQNLKKYFKESKKNTSLWKFGLRIRALCRMKVCDYDFSQKMMVYRKK